MCKGEEREYGGRLRNVLMFKFEVAFIMFFYFISKVLVLWLYLVVNMVEIYFYLSNYMFSYNCFIVKDNVFCF